MQCEFCWTHLYATTEKQLQHRLHNMEMNPNVKVAPCPNCGSTGWVSSREAIMDDPRPWWKRLFDVRLK